MTLVQGLCHRRDVPSPQVVPFLGHVLGVIGSAEAWRHQDIPRTPVLDPSCRGGVAVLGLDVGMSALALSSLGGGQIEPHQASR